MVSCPLKKKYEVHDCVHCAEQVVLELLRVLCSADMTPREHLDNQQALFKQFAEILDFVLRFDDLKVSLFFNSCLNASQVYWLLLCLRTLCFSLTHARTHTYMGPHSFIFHTHLLHAIFLNCTQNPDTHIYYHFHESRLYWVGGEGRHIQGDNFILYLLPATLCAFVSLCVGATMHDLMSGLKKRPVLLSLVGLFEALKKFWNKRNSGSKQTFAFSCSEF